MTAIPLLGTCLIGFAAAIYYYFAATKGQIDAPAAAVGNAIRSGAMLFIRKEYGLLAIVAVLVACLIAFAIGTAEALSFLCGSAFSATAGFAGVATATRANTVAALAARDLGISGAFATAFAGGSVMGFVVAALGLLGLTSLYLLSEYTNLSLGLVTLFGAGASLVALFARTGGGIFTKSADVGADLAGKIELKIPEDDPRNPAVIADNVGDNVGDIGGMGADIFESYCASIIAAIVLALSMSDEILLELGYRDALVFLPIAMAGIGLLACVCAAPVVSCFRARPRLALLGGLIIANALFIGANWVLIRFMSLNAGLFTASVVGALAGILIGLSTDYFTSGARVVRIAEAGKTSAATVVISGMTVGMISISLPLLIVGTTIVYTNHLVGLYGVALAAVSMLATVALIMAVDAYGPIADNAGGIAEMAKLGEATRSVTDQLDALGNTTAAIGKGFAIGAAALAALSLITAYTQTIGTTYEGFELSISDPGVLFGLFLGGLLPFLFSAYTLRAVGLNAAIIVEEVRRQFREIPGLTEGHAAADSDQCTNIAANAALRQVTLPASLALLTPLLVGFVLGPATLGGLLGGSLLTGFVLALFMANAGGAWDNAKKYVEAGHLGGKGSKVHEACIVGDTIGDPFKDTAGPALNILFKVMAMASLVIAPYL